ncbi:sigma-54 dependent transcriptional regulator [Pseudoalteromonas sp. MMG024]|uniref:sigma-54-dependent transcriptional regulator n=1 Tax=Pseudoalteromonas sp. MMG024 TaxID=2909980 RepID=UPI001F23BD11|nr:sigma-54 dependent transcriptional regulator [Pseudoalteromonas sp. MMG024]MCF6455438.1 sigma-54 dependent transcriptional regulator [Pseudoalteromonas sp. MMG024]
MKTILVVDDSLDIQASLKFFLEDEGYLCHGVLSPDTALDYVAKNNVDLVLLDMNFSQNTTSGAEGLSAIEALKELDPLLPVVVMTGWATFDLAVKALTTGAADFIEKPWQDERLAHAIKLQLSTRRDKQDLARLTQEKQREALSQSSLLAYSPQKQQVLSQLENLAKSDMNILLTGENGTGKSYYAQFIHQHSNRSNASFIALNMGAFTDELFNSEMFGHKKGAFTGASQDRLGAFTLAEDGTLFLDEIANLSAQSQAKLLHVLEERKYTALGSSKVLENKARIISATNADLSDAIANELFRQDLYYRLNTVEIEIPPLRSCKDDILPLANQFLTSFCKQYDKPALSLTQCAKQALLNYGFPGNVRELKHIIERVIFMANGQQITAQDLMLSSTTSYNKPNVQHAVDMTLSIDEVIEQALLTRLEHFNGNASKAAKSLGMSRSAWYRKMSKYDAV